MKLIGEMNSILGVTSYIGLGSNIGDKVANIKAALAALNNSQKVRVKRVAPYYRTEPIGYTAQDWFVNTVAELETLLSPHQLLFLLLTLEDRFGRVRTERWGPRVIDLDLLLYDQIEINTLELTIPHPRMHERAFVMVPLAVLAPELVIPGRGKVAELAALLAGDQQILPLFL
ncbi:MAG: 2-amino-4-hydroxy-6-hydroxymethyldihydropteridine pyrophosphokinase [Pelotomaculum sp. PtaB.Bin104]|nr:MAG: 2-amino-4-hydroxy-6-hydroxymethyldihydropteridine pyrophosphokinase [Pelotomaculum sp. PtaB.Bin104]